MNKSYTEIFQDLTKDILFKTGGFDQIELILPKQIFNKIKEEIILMNKYSPIPFNSGAKTLEMYSAGGKIIIKELNEN